MILARAIGEALPIGLHERAVRACESGEGSYLVVAARSGIWYRTLQDLVLMQRKTGTLEARPKGGGNPSPVDTDVLQAVLRDRPDAIVDEIRTMNNARVAKSARVHRSSILRALHRLGCVFKKSPRPAEQDRPDVKARRAAFVRGMKRVDTRRLRFLDESGAYIAMGRGHCWIPKGSVHVDPRPMNWGNNLTMIGAHRVDGWWCVAVFFRSFVSATS